MKGSTGYGLGFFAGFLFTILGSGLVEIGLSDLWTAFYISVCLVVVYVIPSLVMVCFEWRKDRRIRAKLEFSELFIEKYKELIFAAGQRAAAKENEDD